MTGMGSDFRFRTPRIYHTILRDVIMIADTLETAGKMAGLQLLECEILSHYRGRTVDHDE
ncbi:Uncharacterised protein [Segatella copri]|nr:Uncharacterised protein [Segatella copri]